MAPITIQALMHLFPQPVICGQVSPAVEVGAGRVHKEALLPAQALPDGRRLHGDELRAALTTGDFSSAG